MNTNFNNSLEYPTKTRLDQHVNLTAKVNFNVLEFFAHPQRVNYLLSSYKGRTLREDIEFIRGHSGYLLTPILENWKQTVFQEKIKLKIE